MHKQVFFLLVCVISIAFLSNAEGEPEVFMTTINPNSVDNQQDEEISFEGDCNICTEDELGYFYWNSSIEGVLHEGSNPTEINFMLLSSNFHTGEHNVTLQVGDNDGIWSSITDNSTATLNVAGRDEGGGGDGSVTVNFAITPPSFHLGETARFEACTEMQPEPQPCHGDINADLGFEWEIQWEGEDNWSYLDNREAFDYVNFVEGNHVVKLTITDNSDGSEASDTLEIIVLPPIPNVSISGNEQVTIKEGESLVLTATCYDNKNEEVDCTYEWEIWESKDNGDLLYTFTTQSITLDELTNEVNQYDVMARGIDESGTNSQWALVFVTVNPPNQEPSATITISPESLGGLTPEYYQYSNLTFNSANSNDPDGSLVAFNWWFNNEIVSTSENWVSSFYETGIYQVKLEVKDDSGVWSSKVSTNFKIIENTEPKVDFTFEQIGNSFVFNSTSSDLEGYIASYLWWNYEDLSAFSTEENFTWNPEESGTYSITFRATDDGGRSSEITKIIEVKLVEKKNFVATFSSKNINPGDSFIIDFSNTTGSVEYFEIVVTSPNGSRETYETTAFAYTIVFDNKGTYALDITVIWEDGDAQEGLSDWYGPTVYVGTDDEEEKVDDGAPETPSEEDTGLPSISILVSVIIASLVAISRRQR